MRKTNRMAMMRTMLVLPAALATGTTWAAMPPPVVDGNVPAGNIVVEKIDGDTVCLTRELRDTTTDWFYWAFRVKGAKGRTLRFAFDPKVTWGGPVGVRGPAVTTDGGRTWSYPCDGKSTKNTFSYAFDTDDEVRFYVTWQYLPPDWEAFLAAHASDRGKKFETGELCKSRKGRSVPRARFGRLDGKSKYRIFMSSRHHCSEATATPVLEGVAAAFLADDELGRWLCANVELMLVPFTDYDGVEDGDQGKNRAPHDHNRDYTEFLYPETRAIRDWILSHAGGRLDVFIDVHCPWIRESTNEYLYTPWKDPAIVPNAAAEKRFSELLEELQCGSMRYRAKDDLMFGQAWNTAKNYSQSWSAVIWACKTVKGLKIARSYEVPFANANGAVVTPETCRELGRDTAKVFRAILLEATASAKWIGAAGETQTAWRPAEAAKARGVTGHSGHRIDLMRPLPKDCVQLRRAFGVRKVPLSAASVAVTGQGFYELWLNGKKVDSTRVLAPCAWFGGRMCYDVYDVREAIRPGVTNVVGVWLSPGYSDDFSHYGRCSWIAPQRAILKLSLRYADGTCEEIVSDGSWQSTRETSVVSASIYHGETVDARRGDPAWASADGRREGWRGVTVFPDGPQLVRDVAPPIRMYDPRRPVSVKETEPGVWTVDFGQNRAGVVAVRAKGPRGTRIQVQTSEQLKSGGKIDPFTNREAKSTDAFVLAGTGDVEEFAPRFTYHGFRYAEIRGWPGKLSADDVTGWAVGADVRPIASFRCSDAGIEKLHAAADWSMRSNLMSFPTDCAVRDERTACLMDPQGYLDAAFQSFDLRTYCARFLEQADNLWTLEGESDRHGNPDWMGTLVRMPLDLYRYTGDAELLRSRYGRCREIVDSFLRRAPDYIWRKGYGDWLAPNPGKRWEDFFQDVELVETALLCHLLDGMETAAEALGLKEDAVKYRQHARAAKAAFHQTFYHAETATYGDGSQTTSVLPLAWNLVPADQKSAVGAALVKRIRTRDANKLDTGLFGTCCLADVLCDLGEADLAVTLFTQPEKPGFGYMFANGATTLWEQWEERGIMNTHNHAYLSGAASWLYTHLAGIRPAKPGYAEILVKPSFPTSLSFVEATRQTPSGEIFVRWRREKGRIRIETRIPENVPATLELPDGTRQVLRPGLLHETKDFIVTCLETPGAHLYPQPAGEARNAAGYAVTVDGQPAGVAAVRNSAMPVNTRWPGHQRELDQTEVDGMVRFSTVGKTTVAVTAPRDFKEVKVRPSAKGVKPTVAGRTATFTIPGPGYYSVEFDGPHENLHVFADPPETMKAKAGEPGVRYFGPGEHDAGLITLKTGESLYIDEGAVVYGRIEARDADHIRILGRGILDMSRIREQPKPIDPKVAEEQRKKGFAITNVKRWNAVKLEFCDDVLIDGITIRDSLLYNIRPIGCRNLTIRNVKICGNWRYNSDGIDMHNCENVRVSDCFVRTFDDSICVKGFDYTMDEGEMLHDGYRHNVFTNVVVERCTVWCDWGRCLEFGAETRAEEIRDVTWRDCDILHVHCAPLEIQNCDYADIHDVLFENIRLELDHPQSKTSYSATAKSFDPKAMEGQPPVFSSVIHVIAEYSKGDKRRGRNRDIRLKDIHVTGPQMPRFTSRGYDAGHRSTGIIVDGIYWNGREVSAEAAKGQGVGPFADPIRFVRANGAPSCPGTPWHLPRFGKRSESVL